MKIQQLYAGVSKREYAFWAFALGAMLLHLSVASPTFFLKMNLFAGVEANMAVYYSYVYHHILTGIFFVIPFFVFRKKISLPAIFSLGDWRWAWKWTFLAMVLVTFPLYLSSQDPQFLSEYPLSALAFSSVDFYLYFHLAYLVFYIGWEVFFRGFIGYGPIAFGQKPFFALMLQVSLSTIIHIGKPFGELIGSVPGGIFMGVLSYRSGSLLWSIIFHVYVGFMNSYFCWLQG